MSSGYVPIELERVAVLGVDPIALLAARPEPFEPGGIEVNSTQLSASAATELGFGSLVNLTSKGDAFYFSVDFAATQTVSSADTDSAGGYLASIWGAGMRLAVKSWSVQGEVSGSIYGAAASAELGYSKTAFALRTFGTGVAGLQEVTELAKKALGKFDVTSVASLGTAVSVIGKHIEQNIASIKPEPVGLIRSSPPDGPTRLASTVYATQCVAERTSLEDAEQRLSGSNAPDKGYQISALIVRDVFASVFGITDPKQQPPTSARDRALRILRG